VFGPAGLLPRRSVRPAGASRQGTWQGAAGCASSIGRRTGLRPARLGGARLERAGDRILSLAGRRADERMDGLPTGGRCTRRFGGDELGWIALGSRIRENSGLGSRPNSHEFGYSAKISTSIGASKLWAAAAALRPASADRWQWTKARAPRSSAYHP